MTGLDQFKAVVQRFGKIAGYAIGGSALVPIVTAASGLAPSWPKGLAFLASLLMLLTLAATFHFLPINKRRTFSVAFIVGMVFFLATMATHLVLISKFTDEDRGGNQLILGCGWTPEMAAFAKASGIDSGRQCPGDYHLLLKSADGDPVEVFTGNSIFAVAMAMAATWLLFFVSLAFVLGAFVIWYAAQPATTRAEKPPRREAA